MKRTTKTLLLLIGAGAVAWWMLRKRGKSGQAGVGALGPDSFKEESADCTARGGKLTFPKCPPGMICDSMPNGCEFPGGKVKYSRFRPKEPVCGQGWWQDTSFCPELPGRCVGIGPEPWDPMEGFTEEEKNMPIPDACASAKLRLGIPDCGPGQVFDGNMQACRPDCKAQGQVWDSTGQVCQNTLIITPVPVGPTPVSPGLSVATKNRIMAMLRGKPVVSVQAWLRKSNIRYRIVARDGVAFPLSQDRSPDRANLTVVKGVVTRVTWG